MNMRRIYGIGETVLDIIFKDGQPQAAKAGGSMLNSLVSLGRVKLPVSFISEYARDDVGNLIDDFLRANGLDTSFVDRYKDGKTVLALAFLNERNDASYTFYRHFPEKRLSVAFPAIRKDDIVMCGSIFAITPEVREKFTAFIIGARAEGAMVLYDPNFRKAHLSELDALRPYIIENMQMADLVRGSDEDFANIFGCHTAEEAYSTVSRYCKCMVYTANSKGVVVKTPGYSGRFEVKPITPVSTIGAGDNFNAGMVAAIYRQNLQKGQLENLAETEWSKIITTAVGFATEVCMSYENYISEEFAKGSQQ